MSAQSSQDLSLCVLRPDFPLIRTPVIGFRALPNPAGLHPHLITSAKTFFLNRVTSPGYVSLWRSQANPPPSCSLGSIWPVSGHRPIPEPCLQSDVGVCSVSLPWVSDPGLWGLCWAHDAQWLSRERPAPFGVSWAPQPGPVRLPCCALLEEGNESKERLPLPQDLPPTCKVFHKKGENSSRSLPWITFLVDDGQGQPQTSM